MAVDQQQLLPGFRFHPTDQELVIHYLYRKVHGLHNHHPFIPEVHVYKHEPWELPDKSFSPSTHDLGAKVEWYFFAVRGRKYPNGLRMERATLIGFWKSTGKDRAVMHNGGVVGMKKTLVFHTGRAPTGTRTDWVMHEYRLHGQSNHHIQDTYALCRIFKKNTVAPSIDVSGDADMDEDLMQSVPGGIDTDKDIMEYVSDGTDSDNDPNQSVLRSVDSDKYLLQSVFCSVGTDKDPIQVESMSDYAVTRNGGMQFLIGGGDKDKVGAQFLTGGDTAEKESMKHVAGGAYMDSGGMEPVTIDTDKDEVKSMPSGANAGKDISWMEFLRGDVYWNQFIPDGGWNSSADITH